MNNCLSLYIYGNKIANEGYTPLVVVGEPRNIPDGVVGGLESLPYYFTLSIEATHTFFTLVRSDVSSIGAARGGRLKIAIALPKGTALAGGISPLTVLKAINAYYDENYLSNGLMGRQFTEVRENPEAFAALQAQYPIVPVLTPHRVMTGQSDAMVIASEEELAQLMCDAQYPEFVNYRNIILSTSAGASALPRLSVTIPRPRVYALFMQQTKIQDIIDNGQTEIILNVAARQAYEEAYTVKFSLQDARAGRVPNVVVNDMEETIVCSFPPRPKQKACRLIVSTANEAADSAPCPPLTSFYLAERQDATGRNRRPFSPDGTLVLTGMEALWPSPVVGCTDPDWAVSVSQPAMGADGVTEYRAVARRIPVRRYRLQLTGSQNIVGKVRPIDFYILTDATRDLRRPFDSNYIATLRGDEALLNDFQIRTSRNDVKFSLNKELSGKPNPDGTIACCIEVSAIITLGPTTIPNPGRQIDQQQQPRQHPANGGTGQRISIPDWAKYLIGAGGTLLVVLAILAAIFLPGMCSGENGKQANPDESDTEQRDSTKASSKGDDAKIEKARAYSQKLSGTEFTFDKDLAEIDSFIATLDPDQNTDAIFNELARQCKVMREIANELARAQDSKVTKDNLKNDIPGALQTYLNEGNGLTDEQSNILHTLINENPEGYKDTYLVNYYRDPMNSFKDIQAILQKKPVQQQSETPASKKEKSKKKTKGNQNGQSPNPFKKKDQQQ